MKDLSFLSSMAWTAAVIIGIVLVWAASFGAIILIESAFGKDVSFWVVVGVVLMGVFIAISWMVHGIRKTERL